MKRTTILLIFTLFTAGAFGQYSEAPSKLKHEFGFHAGSTTGIGLSYRYWPAKGGIQLTALPIKTDNSTFINVGLTGLCTFYETNYFHFFGYLGTSVTANDYYFEEYEDNYNSNDVNYRLNVGFGPGFGFGSRVRFNLMAGYGFYDVTGKFNIYPTGEIGLYFRL